MHRNAAQGTAGIGSPIITPAQMQAIDAAAPEPLELLIERAAWHVARRARSMLGGVYGRRVTVIAGPGNNGADGLVAARHLSRWGVSVAVVAPNDVELPASDLVIDAAFGTGMNRPYEPIFVQPDVPVLAVDSPSGIDGLTGERLGSPFRADHTVTFAAWKPGLLLGEGPNYAGTVEVADIGLDTSGAEAWLFEMVDARALLPLRSTSDHKWRRAVWVVGGSAGMHGAPLLASRAALRSGSGMVWCGIPAAQAPGLASEVVFRDLPSTDWAQEVIDTEHRFGAIVVGPGLGRSAEASDSVQRLLGMSTKPVVVDGDALRMLGERPTLRANVVLTPHDGEYAALTGRPPGADRFGAARDLSALTGATVLLKGPVTIVASPDGRCRVCAHGDERLATAGTGDVLAGVLGSYLAAGMQPADAAVLAAWMHAEAGLKQNPFGMVASDLLDGLRLAAHQLVNTAPHGDSHASN